MAIARRESKGFVDTQWLVRLVAAGVGIVAYAMWTAFLVYFALMAEAGKNSDPLLALAAIWALGELVWTWIWAAWNHDLISTSPRRAWGDGLLMVSLVLPPILACTVSLGDWEWTFLVTVAITIAGAHGTRILWSMKTDQGLLWWRGSGPVG